MARPKYQGRIDDVVGRVVDVGLDAVVDRIGGFFEQVAENQRATTKAIPSNLRREAYKCSGCHHMFAFEDLAMVAAKDNGFGTCEACFRFMWTAADEKLKLLRSVAHNAAAGAGQRRPPPRPAGAEPRGPKPWEVLGVDADASVEEIKKAYRKNAAAAHPDRVPAGAPDSEKEAARARFEEVDRAFKVMMKVRSPPSAA